MPLILGTNSIKDTGYSVANSCRFDSGTDAHMHITYGTAGNQKKWSWSGWIKRGTNFTTHQNLFAVGSANNNFTFLQFNTSSNIVWYQATSGGTTSYLETDAIYRDPGAWMHVLLSIDTTLSTANNRNRLWVNGTEVTSFTYRTNYDQNHDGGINDDVKHYLGGTTTGISDAEWDGYMAEVVFQDGVAHTGAGDFGEFDSDSPNIWKPKDVSGLTFGSNGFYLDFEDSSALGNDISGNDNDLTVSNIAATDQSLDTCTNNFATLSPLIPNSNITYSEGNLRSVQDGGGDNRISLSTIAVSSGKWYVEHKITQIQDAVHTGIVAADSAYNDGNSLSQLVNAFSYNNDGNVKEYNNSNIDTGEATYTAGDIIGIALDMDNNKVYFHKNGTYINSGNPAGNSNGYSITVNKEYYFAKAMNYAKYTEFNFGSPSFSISSGNSDANGYGNFEYAVPSGYYSLNTKNLAEFG